MRGRQAGSCTWRQALLRPAQHAHSALQRLCLETVVKSNPHHDDPGTENLQESREDTIDSPALFFGAHDTPTS